MCVFHHSFPPPPPHPLNVAHMSMMTTIAGSVTGDTIPTTKKGEDKPRSTNEIKEEIEEFERKLKRLKTELSGHDVTRLERSYTEGCARTARVDLFKRWASNCLSTMAHTNGASLRTLCKTIRDSPDERRHYDYMDAARPGILNDDRNPAVVLDRVWERGVQYLHDVQGYVQLDSDDGGKQCRYELTLYSSDMHHRVSITNYRHNATMIRLPSNDSNCASEATIFLVRALVHICKIHPAWIAKELSEIGTSNTKPDPHSRLMENPPKSADEFDSSESHKESIDCVVPEAETTTLLKEVVARVKALEVRVDAMASLLDPTIKHKRMGSTKAYLIPAIHSE